MKKLIFIIIICFETFVTFAQFGGGDGTAADPYQIYTKAHLEELNESVLLGNSFTGDNFVLMNDISDSLRTSIGVNFNYSGGGATTPFNGTFNGKGHNIVLAIDDTTTPFLFAQLNGNAIIDSLNITGYIFQSYGFCYENYGTIRTCINNLLGDNIYGNQTGICWTNYGIIENCINNANLFGCRLGGICDDITHSNNFSSPPKIINCVNNATIIINNEFSSAIAGGICIVAHQSHYYTPLIIIENSINKGDFIPMGNQEIYIVGGIVANALYAKITNCQNYGNITSNVFRLGGIVGECVSGTCEINNCSNYGKLHGNNMVGGIMAYGSGYSIKNCFNSGNIRGLYYGGIVYFMSFIDGNPNYSPDTLVFNLNVANINNSAITMNNNVTIIDSSFVFRNYYDKQMCLGKGIGEADIQGSAEGKLTTELTGTSPELQAMLGTGWSYSEGRYPIPLGLENDSMALVAASPVYLHFEDEVNYNHVDSVTSNFTVGLGNNVSWNETFDNVNINNENVTLLNLGDEYLTVSLGDYNKTVQINILDIEPIDIQENITEKEIVISPNPAKSNFSIKATLPVEKIEIIGINGNLLYNINCQGETEIKINTELWAKGIYFAKITTTDGEVITEKIIFE